MIKQAKKRVDIIDELKNDVMGEFKAAKMLQDLKYEKIEIIVTIVDMIRNIKKLIHYFKEQLKCLVLNY